MDTFSARLEHAILVCGTSQAEIARSLSVNPSTVNHWCSGRRTPPSGATERIASALGIRPAWLAFGDGEMRDDTAPSTPPTPPTPKRRSVPPPAAPKARKPKRKAAKPGLRKVEPRRNALPEDLARAS